MGERKWIPVSKMMPVENSGEVLVSIWNSDYEIAWISMSYTIDGKWALELPRCCEIVAWQPLPEPYQMEVKG